MWAYNSIFYKIYPIGFCGAPVHNDGVCVPRIRKLMAVSYTHLDVYKRQVYNRNVGIHC